MTNANSTEHAYRRILTRLADLEDQLGAPVELHDLLYRAPLTREELAAVCMTHGPAAADEFAIDTDVLASYLRLEIGALDLIAHILNVTRAAVHQAIRKDMLDKRAKREEDDREFQSKLNWGESAESFYGVAGLF